MAFASISQYIKPEFPVETATESSAGFSWEYIGPDATLRANVPVIGEAWADGRGVTSWELVPSLDNSGHSTLSVSTVKSINAQGASSSTLEDTRYQIRWLPQSLPLNKHPVFAAANAANMAAMLGWERELDNVLQANYQYYDRDSNGAITGSLNTVSNTASPAYRYIRLRLLGHDTYDFFAPSWSKIGTYRGTVAPGVGSIGLKGTPAGSGFPDGWEWVKTDDSAERLGNTARWQRTETWTGALKVDYDLEDIFI